MSKAIELNEANFEQEVTNSPIPVLVDFWAIWCGPCRMIAPIIDQLAEEFEGKVKVCKVNVDENPNLAVRFGVRAIPTLLLFKDGKVVEQLVGVQPKEFLTSILTRYVG